MGDSLSSIILPSVSLALGRRISFINLIYVLFNPEACYN